MRAVVAAVCGHAALMGGRGAAANFLTWMSEVCKHELLVCTSLSEVSLMRLT